MTEATVLVPTHAHVETLRHAVAGVQAQTVQDFELLIVGDGVADDTRAVVAELAAGDERIRFLDLPKAPRIGELNRHAALQGAAGRFVAYLGDDDWWMPDHLEVLGGLLRDADFAHTLQLGIGADGDLVAMPADLAQSAFRRRMCDELFNRFDFTFAGHTLDAYRRLPHGWQTTPPEFPWSDLWMWRQFLAQPWCRAASAMVPTGINTCSHLRRGLSVEERAALVAEWRGRMTDPTFREVLWRRIAAQFASESVRFELEAVHAGEIRADLAEARAALARAHADLAGASAARDTTWAALMSVRRSRSWRATAPLRRLAAGVRR